MCDMRLFLSIASNTSQLFRSSHNSWKRHIHAGLPVQGSHRPRLLDAEAEKQLLEYLGERGKEGNAVTMSEFPSVVRTYAEQTADRAGMNSFGVTEPSLSSLKRLRKRLGLLRRNAVSSQALRRLEVTRCDTPFLVTVNACMHASSLSLILFQANSDMLNFASMAAVYSAVVGPTNVPRGIPLHLCFNSDVTSLLLTTKNEDVLITHDVDAFLREHDLGVAHTHTDTKARVVSLMFTIAADGSLLCIVVFVKDLRFSTAQIIKVCMCDLHLFCHRSHNADR